MSLRTSMAKRLSRSECAGVRAAARRAEADDPLCSAFWKFIKLDDPDTCILRFLRARKWDVGRGMAMLAGCMKWRLDNGIEDLALGGDEGNAKIEKFLEQQRSGKTYAFGAAKNECPCCYIHVRKHFTKGQPAESMQK